MKHALPALALCATAFAAGAQETGGFAGPDNARSVTAADAAGLPDDTDVRITGYIVRSLGDEKYEFRDDSGTLTVEIDDDEWRGVQVTPDVQVELRGEIEQESDGPELEVESLRVAN